MENQRIRLSKAMLKNALIELLQTTSMDKISIYALCDTAQINRATFYKYYGSQYELLEDIERDCFAELGESLKKTPPSVNNLRAIFEYLEKNESKFKTLINTTVDKNFADKLFNLPEVVDGFNLIMPDELPEKLRKHIRLFVFHGWFAILRDWLNDDDRATPAEVTDIIMSMADILNKNINGRWKN